MIMKLRRIDVNGFRNVKETSLIFDSMLSLVSLNSYGKSNLLKSIDFGIDFIKLDSNDKKKSMKWDKAIPLNKEIARENFFIEIEFIDTVGADSYSVIYGYEFEWAKKDNKGAKIVSEYLKSKLNEKNQKYNYLVKRDTKSSLYKTAITGRCDKKINIENNELIINKLEAYDDLYFIDIVKSINNLTTYIDRHLDPERSYQPDPIIRKGTNDLSIGSTNLPRALYYLKKHHEDKYELLIDAYLQLFPQFNKIVVKEFTLTPTKLKDFPEDVPFVLTDKIHVVYISDVHLNQPINVEGISDGAKRVLLLLTNIILAEINGLSLIAIEEPENSVHPSLLQSYLRIIASLLDDCQIILTSHSPYIIKYQNPDSIYIGMPNDTGVAQFKRINKTGQNAIIKDAEEYNMSIGDYIFDLLSGTETEYEILAEYLED